MTQGTKRGRTADLPSRAKDRGLFQKISVIQSVQRLEQRDNNYSMTRREYVRIVANLLQLIRQQPTI